MNKRKLRQLAKQINYGNEVKINFVFAPADHFCYESSNHTLEISSFYYRLSKSQICIYLIHEIGHMNTISSTPSYYLSDYTAEYEANRWAMYRLDELKWYSLSGKYQEYLQEISALEVTDEEDEEYKEAAVDLLQELELA